MLTPIRKTPTNFPLIPVIHPKDLPDRNKNLFLTEWHGKPLTKTVKIVDEILQTAPLALTGERIDLMGISNSSYLMACGVIDVSDHIDPAVGLKEVYIDIGGDLFAYDVSRYIQSAFAPVLVGDTRSVVIDCNIPDMTVNPGESSYTGELPIWTPWNIYLGDIQFSLHFTGSINIHRGDATFAATIKLTDNQKLDSRAWLMLRDKIKVVGFTLDASFTNFNRRKGE